MGWPTTTVTKSLLAASSTSIGSFSSAGVVTLSCATLDTARRITVVGTSILGMNFTITGTNQFGKTIQETVLSATTVAGSATTTQDFLKVTAITISCALASSGGGLFGTSTQGGTPWVPVDVTRNPLYVGFGLVPTSSLTATSFEYTQDYPYYDPITNTWPNAAFPTKGPQPTISSLGSSVIGPAATQGYINFPIAAWRVTFTSCSSALGSANASVTQLGV